MHKFSLILFLVLCLSIVANSQVVEVARIPALAQSFKVDKLGSFYFLNNNVLKKTDKDNNLLASYDKYSFGGISVLDVSDPLRILLFYSDFNSIVYLDNNLSELRDPIILDNLEYYDIQAVCSSTDGGFWVYDNQKSQVKSHNKNLSVVKSGVMLYSMIENDAPTEIILSTNYIFLKLNSNGIIVLDKFGNYISKVESESESIMSIDNDILYLLDSNSIKLVNIVDGHEEVIPIPELKVVDFEVSGKKMFILADKSLITFEIQ